MPIFSVLLRKKLHVDVHDMAGNSRLRSCKLGSINTFYHHCTPNDTTWIVNRLYVEDKISLSLMTVQATPNCAPFMYHADGEAVVGQSSQ